MKARLKLPISANSEILRNAGREHTHHFYWITASLSWGDRAYHKLYDVVLYDQCQLLKSFCVILGAISWPEYLLQETFCLDKNYESLLLKTKMSGQKRLQCMGPMIVIMVFRV